MNKRILLCCCYDGTHYYGWQKQKKIASTLQNILEQAISNIAQHPVHLVASGRTDKGVHAFRQVLHFDTTVNRAESAWVFGVNHYLPKDIAILAAREVSDNFHARFSAQKRIYRYVLCSSKIRPTVLRNKVGWTFKKLDVVAMNQAVQKLLGKHDFSSFRSSDCQARTPIKTMYYTKVYCSQGLICFDFMADGFLHHMVRNIVGALIYVGSGKWDVDDFIQLFCDRNRYDAPPTFMPQGLYFLGARYPANFDLQLPKIDAWFWGDNEFINQN